MTLDITDTDPRALFPDDARSLYDTVRGRRAAPKPCTVERSDSGVAAAVAAAVRDKLRRARDRDTFLAWDGEVWSTDADAPQVAITGLIQRQPYATDVDQRQRKIIAYTMRKLSKSERDDLAAAGQAADADGREITHVPEEDTAWSESAAAVRNVRTLLSTQSEIVCDSGDFDSDPYIVGAAGAYLDLRSLHPVPMDPRHLVTKRLGTAWDPAAQCPLWEQFLGQVLPDAEVRAYVQRVVGMALLGEQREARVFCLTGTGANGKSVFADTLADLFGSYAATLPASLIAGAGTTHPTELMPLLGARLAVVPEVPMGVTWDADWIKSTTGGDRITARGIGENPVTWTASHTLMVLTNGTPMVAAGNAAFWRRYREIPFTSRFATSQAELPGATGWADPTLPEKLRHELPGILRWAAEGYAAYASMGLMEPSAVEEASDTAARQANPWSAFCREMLELDPTASTPVKDLWTRWQIFREAETDWTHSRPNSARSVPQLLMSELPQVRCTKSTGGKSPAMALGVKLTPEGMALKPSTVLGGWSA